MQALPKDASEVRVTVDEAARAIRDKVVKALNDESVPPLSPKVCDLIEQAVKDTASEREKGRWYTEQELRHYLSTRGHEPELIETLAGDYAFNLQKAFEKGGQVKSAPLDADRLISALKQVSNDRRTLEDGCAYDADKDRSRLRSCILSDIAEVIKIASS